MNATTTNTRKFVIATIVALVALLACSCEASLVKMGLNKDKMPVNIDDVLHTFERARRLQFFEMRQLQSSEGVAIEDKSIEVAAVENHGHDHLEGDESHSDIENAIFDVAAVEDRVEEDDGESHSEAVTEFVDMQEQMKANAGAFLDTAIDTIFDENENSTSTDEDESPFFGVDGEDEQDETEQPVVEEVAMEVPVVEEDLDLLSRASIQFAVETGPRGGSADVSPKLQPTELSFMIIMEDFRYSDGVESIYDIKIGTKFGFTGRVATKAEDLGVASGSCTVTSDIKKELSYCDIYHKIDTDNFGGFGSVMVAGTADEVGGRLLVTGTGGSLQSTNKGYAMVQFDPAGNPVLYVLLKLF